jgi:membrane-associated phospholipid phosphatase
MNYSYLNKSNKIFLVFYLVCLLLFFYPVIYINKLELINEYNFPKNSILLQLFRFLTSLAEGLFVTLVIIYFLFKKLKYALAILFSVVVSGIFAQFFKRILFSDHYRPFYYLKGNNLEWMDIHEKIEYFSFPSGHTTTAFAMFFILIFINSSNWLKTFLFIVMLLISISRVYLFQHFHRDIYAGSILGTIFAILSLPILNSEKPILQKSIIQVFKKQSK